MHYRCHMKTRPGMFAQYDGYVDVYTSSNNDWENLFDLALLRLRRTSFPDYPAEAWKMEKVELIHD